MTLEYFLQHCPQYTEIIYLSVGFPSCEYRNMFSAQQLLIKQEIIIRQHLVST